MKNKSNFELEFEKQHTDDDPRYNPLFQKYFEIKKTCPKE